MTEHSRNALIGLFVLGGLVCLGALIVKFGESRGLFSKRYVVKAEFDRIEGVREGTDVNLAGVWAGSVLRIDLVNSLDPTEGVVVEMEIDNKFSVPQDSVAVVATALMGQAAINIIPPPVRTNPLPQDGSIPIKGIIKNPLDSVIDPEFMSALEKTTHQIGILAEALTPAANAITDLLQQRTIHDVEASQAATQTAPSQEEQQLTANLYTAVERLHNVLKHIETVLGDPEVQSNFKETLTYFKEASKHANEAAQGFKTVSDDVLKLSTESRQVVGKLGTTLDITKKHIDELGTKLTVNSDKLSRLLDNFIAASEDLSQGNGTMGMLLRDPKFYDELLLTTKRLGNAAVELQVLIKQWQKEGLLSSMR